MEKSFKGIVTTEGKLKIYDLASFNAHLGTEKGKGVIITLITEDPKSSIYSQNYFRMVICVEFVKIFKAEFNENITKEIAGERLKSWCPLGRDENGEIQELEKYSQPDLNELIRNSKYIASHEFDYFIKD